MKTMSTIVLLWVLMTMLSCTQKPYGEALPPVMSGESKEEATEDSLIDGCRRDTIKVPHYILGFWQPTYFAASAKIKGSIAVEFGAEYDCWFDDRNPGRDDAETRRAQDYAALCERYQDNTYSALRSFYPFYTGGYSYLTDNIVSIDVVCETTYDAEHPAGSSLSDICILEWESPYKHIKSGYTSTHDWPKVEYGYWQQDKGSIPLSKPLADCVAEDFVLMGDGWFNLCNIKLTKLPLSGNDQLLAVVLVDESGRTYKCSVGPFRW